MAIVRLPNRLDALRLRLDSSAFLTISPEAVEPACFILVRMALRRVRLSAVVCRSHLYG